MLIVVMLIKKISVLIIIMLLIKNVLLQHLIVFRKFHSLSLSINLLFLHSLFHRKTADWINCKTSTSVGNSNPQNKVSQKTWFVQWLAFSFVSQWSVTLAYPFLSPFFSAKWKSKSNENSNHLPATCNNQKSHQKIQTVLHIFARNLVWEAHRFSISYQNSSYKI